MELFLAQLFNGIALGSIYVLLVTGFNLMIQVAKIIQFAYPQFVILSMYAIWGVLQSGGSILLAAAAGLASSIILNLLSEPIFRRVNNIKENDINISFVASLGISLVVVELMSHSLNHGFPVSFPLRWTGGRIFRYGLISLGRGEAAALITGIIAVLGFFYLLYRTGTGRVLRAVAENRQIARLAGLPLLKTGLISYLLAGILGGIIAILFSMLLGYASPWLGEAVGLKVLAVSIVAGIGNLKGGLYIGIMLGIVEALSMGYLAGSWSNVIAFVFMLAAVLIRPQGIFGSRI